MKVTKRQSKIRIGGAAGVITLGFFIGIGLAFYFAQLNTKPTVNNKSNFQVSNSDNSTPVLKPVSEVPSRLIIEKIEVDAEIQAVGLTETGAMDAPRTNEGVGWYDKSALAGHSDFAVLLDGHFGTDAKPAVFYRLSELLIGDTVHILGKNGTKLTYKIVETLTQELEDVDMHKALYPYREGVQSLTIITCEGTYDQGRSTYDKRSIVYAERIL